MKFKSCMQRHVKKKCISWLRLALAVASQFELLVKIIPLSFVFSISCIIAELLLSQSLCYPQEQQHLAAPKLHFGFEGNQAAFEIEQATTGLKVLGKSISSEHAVQGTACEEILLQASQLGETLVLGKSIEPARILDDVEVSLQIHSPQASCTLGLEVLFPETIDPRTNQPFVGNILSTPLQATKDWQTIKILISPLLWQERTRLWKAQLRPQMLNTRNAQISKVLLFADCNQGKNLIRVDNLLLTPFIEMQQGAVTVRDSKPSKIKFGMGRITINDRPFLPLVVPYHGEDLTQLHQAGFNVIWVDDRDVPKLAKTCEELGLWMTTSPPVDWDAPVNPLDSPLDQRLGEEYRRVLFWNLGTRVDFIDREKFRRVAKKIREIDPWHRPLCIDVRDAEEVFSRDVEILSITRHVMHTTSTLKDFRSHLLTRSSMAEPGAFLQTHIQTEPSPLHQLYGSQLGKSPPVIEPEQIRLQVYAALTCGIRGVSYWKSSTWDHSSPNYKELLAACAQIHQEIKVLEPFLATGSVVDQFEFEVSDQFDQQQVVSQNRVNSKGNIFLASRNQQLAVKPVRNQSKHHATMIQSDWGHLIIACGLDESAQYTPPTQTSPEARFIVRGVPESALAWEITPTAMIPLEIQRVAGGVQISLIRTQVFHRFDQTAAILISSSRELEAQVQQAINQVKNVSAQTSLKLADLKWNRVRNILTDLVSLGQGLTNDPALSRFVDQLIAEAKKKYIDQDFHSSRMLSARAMQIMRNIQYSHWLHAKNKIQHPNSTPYTICFQTLPEFWRLMASVGASQGETTEGLIVSGEFENLADMQQEGWQRQLARDNNLLSFLELHPEHQGIQGDYALRLTCIPRDPQDIPAIIRDTPIQLVSPKIMLKKGDLLHVSGYITIDQPIKGSLQGLRIYDSLLDTPGSIIWNDEQTWNSFQMIREIPADMEYQLTTELTGMGDCRLDHFKFKILKPTVAELPQTIPQQEKKNSTFSNSLEFLERLSPIRSSKEDGNKGQPVGSDSKN